MTTYELLIIHNPLLTDQQYQEQMTRVKDLLVRNGAEVKSEDLWGKRRLAYPIEKQREGHYAVLHFDAAATSTCLSELDRFCKIEESVLRHLLTKAVLNKSLGTPPEQRSFDEEDSQARPRIRASAEIAEPRLAPRARQEVVAKEAAAKETGAKEAGAKETDAKEPEAKKTGAKEPEAKDTGPKEAGAKETEPEKQEPAEEVPATAAIEAKEEEPADDKEKVADENKG